MVLLLGTVKNKCPRFSWVQERFYFKNIMTIHKLFGKGRVKGKQRSFDSPHFLIRKKIFTC
jgi:hypothetical protein